MMHSTSKFSVASLGVAVITASTVFASQGPTLPEEAAASPTRTVRKTLLRETPLKSLEQLAAKADVIVEGTMIPSRTYLAENQREIYTDYVVMPLQMHAQRSVPTRSSPGPTKPLTVTMYGGHMVINGAGVTLTDGSLSEWQPAARLLLFLKRADDGTYRVCYDVAGVFRVDGEKVTSMVREPRVYRKLDGIDMSEVKEKIKLGFKR
jgi:hypothetical protein